MQEKRIFPAVDIVKSGTRREDLLLNEDEQSAVNLIRKYINDLRPEEAVEQIISLFARTKNNAEFCQLIHKVTII